jgi:hypothetical protein
MTCISECRSINGSRGILVGAKKKKKKRTRRKRQDDESITGLQGSQNETLRIPKLLFNSCSDLQSACSGGAQECSPQLRLEQQQLRSRNGNGKCPENIPILNYPS